MLQGIILKVILGTSFIAGAYGFYLHYMSMRLELSTLKQNLVTESKAHEQTKKSLSDFITRSYRQQQEAQKSYEALDSKYKASRIQVAKLENTLSTHDFKYLLREKPAMVLSRVNSATERVLMELKTISNRGNKPNGPGSTD